MADLFAEIIIPPNPQFDPNAFWTGLFTCIGIVVPVLGTVIIAWFNLRSGQKKLDTRLTEQDIAAAVRTRQITDVQTKLNTIADSKVDRGPNRNNNLGTQ